MQRLAQNCNRPRIIGRIEAVAMSPKSPRSMRAHRYAGSDAGLRWTAVTIDDGDNAKSALDGVTIQQDVLDRIAPTASWCPTSR